VYIKYMINPSIDTDTIGKHIWNELYRISSKKNITQTELEKKCWILQTTISAYFTGKKTTKNLEQYWRIAEAIPISRSEFDQIVDDAKRKVLGDMWQSNKDPKVAFFADVGVTDKNKQDAIMKMIEAFKDV